MALARLRNTLPLDTLDPIGIAPLDRHRRTAVDSELTR
jgi:hypothetical protein